MTGLMTHVRYRRQDVGFRHTARRLSARIEYRDRRRWCAHQFPHARYPVDRSRRRQPGRPGRQRRGSALGRSRTGQQRSGIRRRNLDRDRYRRGRGTCRNRRSEKGAGWTPIGQAATRELSACAIRVEKLNEQHRCRCAWRRRSIPNNCKRLEPACRTFGIAKPIGAAIAQIGGKPNADSSTRRAAEALRQNPKGHKICGTAGAKRRHPRCRFEETRILLPGKRCRLRGQVVVISRRFCAGRSLRQNDVWRFAQNDCFGALRAE